jgi:hypothetical protein
VSAEHRLAQAVTDWQRKHRVADDDPVMATLELMRIYLREARGIDNESESAPPSFEDFRGTIELLDRRSKGFIQQTSELVAELRRFGLNLNRINRARIVTQLALLVAGIAIGGLLTWFL